MPDLRSQGHTGGAGPHPARPKVVPFGKYLLLERISVGGMAEVYKAKAFGVEGFEKILAIKRILPTIAEDEEFIDMFIDEAKIVGQLSHANICQVLELGRIGDSHFIAMEYIWGRDLLQIQNHFRRQKQVMPVPMAVFIISKVCEGLDYAHRKRDPQGRPLNIVHRDVSPQNCLVAYEGAVKLIDFGIARAAYRQTRTQAGVLKGKFGYMSPEQVRGLPIDRRSDLFAVGTLLYELLTGERLFLGESDFSTLDKVRNAEVEPPTKYNRNIPPDLERIVMKALAKETDDRWQWASELQEALQRVLINFKPVFTTQKLSAWMKQTFASQIARDKAKMEEYARIGQDVLQQIRRQKPPPPPPPQAKASSPPPPTAGIAGQSVSESQMIMTSSGEQVSIDAAEMDWLMSGADEEDDFSGESTVIANLDISDDEGTEDVGEIEEIPDDFDEDDFDEEEATAIYFVNEDAIQQLENPQLQLEPDEDEPVSEQATRMLDHSISEQATRMLDHSVSEQSTVIFDEKKARGALAAENGVSVSPAVMLQSGPGEELPIPGPDQGPEVPVPLGEPARPSPAVGPPGPPPGGGKAELPRTMLKPPGDGPPMASFPGLGPPAGSPSFPASAPAGPQPPGPGPAAPFPGAEMPPGQPPSTHPVDPPLKTELVRGRGKQAKTEKKKKRSPLVVIALAAAAVIVLGGIAGVVALFVIPSLTGTSEASPDTQAAVTSAGDDSPSAGESEGAPASQAAATGSEGVTAPTESSPARLFLTIDADSPSVEIDGDPVELSALATGVELTPGTEHRVRVTAPGRVAQELTLTPSAGQEERREITLALAGQLALTTTPPQAEVELDGETAGNTPLTLEDLEYGEHSVRIALKGYEPVERSVSLTESEPHKELTINLEKIRVAHSGGGSRTPRGHTGRQPEDTGSGGGQGFLVVSTQPWGHVFVDGRDTGRDTPILPSNPLRLSPGRHRLTIQTNSGQRFTFTVNIASGETTRFMRRLEVR